MLSEDIKKNIEGLCTYIMEFEPSRPPAPIGIIPYSFSTFFELMFKQKQRNYFVRNNPNLYQKTRKEMEPYLKNATKFSFKEKLSLYFYLLILSVLVLGLSIIVSNVYSLNIFHGSLFLVVIGLPSYYLFIIWIIKMRRDTFGEKYDNNIKIAVQILIDYGSELIKKENLNPQDFPIKLRHNDYNGLVYGKKGKNNYVEFFEK
jgi:uncharacterized Tic20 family protein